MDSELIKIACLSDTHCAHELVEVPEDADIVLHAGDFSSTGRIEEVIYFLKWYEALPNPHKIFISGNHDAYDEILPGHFKTLLKEHAPSVTYLRNEGCEVMGLKIWGRPETPQFGDWYFMADRGSPRMRSTLDVIPAGTDIILTHGPAYGILDKTYYGSEHVGCADLKDALERIKPQILVFGHIHEGYGQQTDANGVKHINCAIMDVRYKPVNSPIIITVDKPIKS